MTHWEGKRYLPLSSYMCSGRLNASNCHVCAMSTPSLLSECSPTDYALEIYFIIPMDVWRVSDIQRGSVLAGCEWWRRFDFLPGPTKLVGSRYSAFQRCHVKEINQKPCSGYILQALMFQGLPIETTFVLGRSAFLTCQKMAHT